MKEITFFMSLIWLLGFSPTSQLIYYKGSILILLITWASLFRISTRCRDPPPKVTDNCFGCITLFFYYLFVSYCDLNEIMFHNNPVCAPFKNPLDNSFCNRNHCFSNFFPKNLALFFRTLVCRLENQEINSSTKIEENNFVNLRFRNAFVY